MTEGASDAALFLSIAVVSSAIHSHLTITHERELRAKMYENDPKIREKLSEQNERLRGLLESLRSKDNNESTNEYNP